MVYIIMAVAALVALAVAIRELWPVWSLRRKRRDQLRQLKQIMEDYFGLNRSTHLNKIYELIELLGSASAEDHLEIQLVYHRIQVLLNSYPQDTKFEGINWLRKEVANALRDLTVIAESEPGTDKYRVRARAIQEVIEYAAEHPETLDQFFDNPDQAPAKA